MSIPKKSILASVLLAFITCVGLCSRYVLTEPLWGDSASLFTLFFFLLLSCLYKRAFFPFDKRRVYTASVFGLLMGYMLLLGARYARDTVMSYNMPSFCLALLSAGLLFTALLSLLFNVLPGAEKRIGAFFGGFDKGQYGIGMESNFKTRFRKLKGFKLYFLILFITGLLYIPTFLAVYPGIYSYDASVQVLQIFGEEPLTTHHPLLHTLFFCGALKLGELLFGSFQAGMAVHSILQAALVGAAFSYVIWWMINRKKPVLLILLTYLFLVVNPYFQIFVFVTTKDVLFGVSFMLLFLFAFQMAENSELFFKSFRLQLRFFMTALLMCFLRNQGIYVLLFFGIFYMFFLLREGKKRAVKWIFSIGAVTGIYLIITGPVFGAFGVEKGDVREMLSVPMQQLARAYHEEQEQLSSEEKNYIETLILPEYLEQYVSVNADPVKSGFQTNVLEADPGKFLRTWLSVGKKAPLIYADSFLMGNWGYWYPEDSQYWIHYIIFDGAFLDSQYNILNIRRDSRFLAYENYLREISLTPAFEKIPVLSVMLNQAFPFWLLLTAAAVSIYHKKLKYFPPFILLLGYWGTLLLGPVTSVRYALPLMMCVPLLCVAILDIVSEYE